MKNKTRNANSGNSLTAPILITASVLVIIRFLPLFVPFDGLWGISHIHFMSLPFVILTAIIAVMYFVFQVRPADKIYLSAFDTISERFFGGKSIWPVLIVGAGSVVIFWFLRMPANLLGDGYTVINNIGTSPQVIFKWSEVGAVRIVNLVAQIVPAVGIARGEYAYAIVSVISGALAVIAFYLLALELGRNNSQRFSFFLLTVFAGWTLLFFGYAENYPILWPVILFYLYAAYRRTVTGRGLVAAAVLLATASFLHLMTLFLVPSFIYLIFCRGRGLKIFRRFRTLWISVLGLSVIAALILFILAYNNSLELRYHLLPLFKGKEYAPDYAIFSWRHWRDIANEIYLLVPVIPILIIMAFPGWRRRAWDKFDAFLLVFSGMGLLFLMVVDPQLGMGRDWDLFALTALGPMVFFLRHAIEAGGRIIKVLPVLALALVIPFLSINLAQRPAIDYVKYLLTLEKDKSRAGMAMVHDYLARNGFYEEADSLMQTMRRTYVTMLKLDQAVSLARSGQTEEALRIADSLNKVNPYRAAPYFALGVIYALNGRLEIARDKIEEGLKLAPYTNYAIANLALIYGRLGDYDKMMNYLRRAQKLNPNSRDVNIGLIDAFEKNSAVDSVYKYSLKLLDIDPRNTYALLKAGVASYNKGDDDAARKYLGRYVELVPEKSRDELATAILKKLNDK